MENFIKVQILNQIATLFQNNSKNFPKTGAENGCTLKKKRFFTKPKEDLHLDTAKEPLIVLYNKSFVQKVL